MSDQDQSKDTGRDCPYCGGVIYRVENESGNIKTAFHNCNMCGARWSDSWSLTSPGNRAFTTGIGRAPRVKESTPPEVFAFNWRSIKIPTWGWIVIVLIGAFALVRLGALTFLSYLLLPLTVIILGYIVFNIGKEQRWW